jgi:hypothetical protein
VQVPLVELEQRSFPRLSFHRLSQANTPRVRKIDIAAHFSTGILHSNPASSLKTLLLFTSLEDSNDRRYKMVVCAGPSLTVESYEDSDTATSTGKEEEDNKPIYRRRHSSFHPRRKSEGWMEDDRLLLRVWQIYTVK